MRSDLEGWVLFLSGWHCSSDMSSRIVFSVGETKAKNSKNFEKFVALYSFGLFPEHMNNSLSLVSVIMHADVNPQYML